MPSLTQLRRQIEEFLAAHAGAEVTEDGDLLFDLRRSEFSVEETRGRLLLHLWSEERNWVRRVIGVSEQGDGRLEIDVERFGQSRPGRLSIASPTVRREATRDRQSARRSYSRFFRRLLEREFPGAEVDGLTSKADLKRSFSGLYTRARLREGRRWWAALGVSEAEPAPAADSILTCGLIWLDWNRRNFPDRVWAGLRLFVPPGGIAPTMQRLLFLDPKLATFELYTTDKKTGGCALVNKGDAGNLATRITPAKDPARLPVGGSEVVERIRRLAPEAIEAAASAGGDKVVLRFRGLEFARVSAGDAVFGAGGEEEVLREDNFEELAALVEQLKQERVPGGRASDALYRWRAEAWLEQLAAAQPARLDPRLRPEFIYRQVLVGGGTAHGVADLLGVTRDGRLVVIELKASSDIHLPLQGLDYWMRVAWHHERGEVAASGYFPGVELKAVLPELVLVAPALQVHPTAHTVTGYFSPQVLVTLVGLNEDWRRELKVVWRQPGRAK